MYTIKNYLDSLKSNIENLDFVSDVFVFGGNITEEDVKNCVKIRDNRVNIFISAFGGDLTKAHKQGKIKQELNVNLFIVGQLIKEKDYISFSDKAVESGQKIIGMIESNKLNDGIDVKGIPNLQNFIEIGSSISGKVNYSVWSISYTNDIILDTE